MAETPHFSIVEYTAWSLLPQTAPLDKYTSQTEESTESQEKLQLGWRSTGESWSCLTAAQYTAWASNVQQEDHSDFHSTLGFATSELWVLTTKERSCIKQQAD